MLKAGQIEQAQITGYTAEGDGVCRIDGCVVFVPNAIRDEVCRVKIVHVGAHSAHGKIEEILERSSHRVRSACPYSKRCGGCRFWHMDYAEELSLKAQRVQDALTRIGGVELSSVPILGALSCEGYRNKAQYPVQPQKGRAVAGFYREKSHDVVPVERCLIQDAAADAAKRIVLAWAAKYKVSAYDEQTRRGLLRHIYVRKGFATGEVMVCLVANGSTLPQQQRLVDGLREGISGLRSVLLCVNQTPGNVILSGEYRTLWGQDFIEDRLCGLIFRLSPRSFYQVNHDQAERLYEKAVKAAALTGAETVLDLYCGTGTITLVMARHAKRAVGVELVAQAIDDAKENARRNGIKNAEFFCADAGEAAKRLALDGIKPDVIVVDPPRKGLSADVIDAIAEMSPARVVYVSCDPATLARDVKLLTAQGYIFQTAEAVDMFPRTAHVETVVLLSQRKPDDVIEIDMDLDELDITSAETKATYREIQQYVLKETGLMVSNLYIAQVKDKCGMDKRPNYNLPKSKDSRQPQCPPEKEAAIMAALKHFNMI